MSIKEGSIVVFKKAWALTNRSFSLVLFFVFWFMLYGFMTPPLAAGVSKMVSDLFFVMMLAVPVSLLLQSLALVAVGRQAIIRLSPIFSQQPLMFLSFRPVRGIYRWDLMLSFLIAVFIPYFCFVVIGWMTGGRLLLSFPQIGILLSPVLFYFIAGRCLTTIDQPPQVKLGDIPLYAGAVLFLLAAIGLSFRDLISLIPGLASISNVSIVVEIAVVFLIGVYVFFLRAEPLAQRELPVKGKELILIRPPMGGLFMSLCSSLGRSYPSFFAVLRAFTPAEYKIIEINGDIWGDWYVKGGSIVAISCHTENSLRAYGVARKFRDAGSKVIMGGPHVSVFPQEALEYCDAVVVGAAESVWAQIISDYEQGNLQKIYQGVCLPEHLERFHKALASMPSAVVSDVLMLTRGCKFNCYFCASRLSHQTEPRPMEEMIPLVLRAYQYGGAASFLDSNIFINREYAKKFLEALIPLKLRWDGCVSIDVVRDDGLVDLLKKSGCNQLLIGYEVAAKKEGPMSKGKFSLVGEYLSLTRKLQKAGIKIRGQFMFGCPQDSWESFWDLWRFCFILRPTITHIAFMSPLPGSAYYDDMARENKLIDLNWRNYTGSVMVCEHDTLKPCWLLRKGFILILTLFFLTTSRAGLWIILLLGAMSFFIIHLFL